MNKGTGNSKKTKHKITQILYAYKTKLNEAQA
jgi:hypothetical protein